MSGVDGEWLVAVPEVLSRSIWGRHEGEMKWWDRRVGEEVRTGRTRERKMVVGWLRRVRPRLGVAVLYYLAMGRNSCETFAM